MKGEERKRDMPERSFQLALRIVRLCQELDKQPGISRTLSNQLLRSGTSVGANELIAILTTIIKKTQAGMMKGVSHV